MCAIIFFQPRQMITMEHLQNACFNNWHSYGLVIRVDGQLDIRKKLPENGEISAEEIMKLLEENKEYERYLHVRHNTAGATTYENTHPFEVYYNAKQNRHVAFMHNGTMHEYKSKKMVNGKAEDDNDGPSDTQNFVNWILTPYLEGCDFEGKGNGYYQSYAFRRLFTKFFPSSSNRCLLIANDQDPWFVGEWKKFKSGDDELTVSNTDYFNAVQRGPEHDRRLVRAAEDRAKNEQKGTTTFQAVATGGKVRSLKDIKGGPRFAFDLNASIPDLMNDYKVWDRPGCSALGLLNNTELHEFVQKDIGLLHLEWALTDYRTLYEEYLSIEDKHDKSTKMNATQAKIINNLQEENEKLKAGVR